MKHILALTLQLVILSMAFAHSNSTDSLHALNCASHQSTPLPDSLEQDKMNPTSRHTDAPEKEFNFDRHFTYFGVTAATSTFRWDERPSSAYPMVTNRQRLSTYGVSFGFTRYIRGIPQKYAVGAQFAVQFGVAGNQRIVGFNPDLKLGVVNTFRIGNKSALDLNLNTGISGIIWEYERDAMLNFIILPEKAVGFIKLAPEVKYRYQHIGIGLTYEHGFNIPDNSYKSSQDQMSIQLAYCF